MRTRFAAAVVLCAALVLASPLAAPAEARGHAWRTTLHFKWQGYHRYGTTQLTLLPDGSLRTGGRDRGTWVLDHPSHRIFLRFDTGCAPVYRGHLRGKTAGGAMHCRRYGGVWYIDRLRPVHR
jgi:hypothetical protein